MRWREHRQAHLMSMLRAARQTAVARTTADATDGAAAALVQHDRHVLDLGGGTETDHRRALETPRSGRRSGRIRTCCEVQDGRAIRGRSAYACGFLDAGQLRTHAVPPGPVHAGRRGPGCRRSTAGSDHSAPGGVRSTSTRPCPATCGSSRSYRPQAARWHDNGDEHVESSWPSPYESGPLFLDAESAPFEWTATKASAVGARRTASRGTRRARCRVDRKVDRAGASPIAPRILGSAERRVPFHRSTSHDPGMRPEDEAFRQRPCTWSSDGTRTPRQAAARGPGHRRAPREDRPTMLGEGTGGAGVVLARIRRCDGTLVRRESLSEAPSVLSTAPGMFGVGTTDLAPVRCLGQGDAPPAPLH